MAALGILFLAVGAVVYWAIDVDTTYVDLDALGAILMIAGIVALIVAAVTRSRPDEPGTYTGITLIVVGAVICWAVVTDIPQLSDDALGVLLMVLGVLSIIVAVALKSERAENLAGLGLALIGLGAIAGFVLELDLPYVLDDALGVILIVAGVISLIIAFVAEQKERSELRERARSLHQQPRYPDQGYPNQYDR